mgnify:CR=1 FL=1
MENLLSSCEVVPAVDQLEFHPGYSQEAAVCYCQERGILVQAWSPLGRKRVMDDELVEELAKGAPCYAGTDLSSVCAAKGHRPDSKSLFRGKNGKITRTSLTLN